MFPSCFIYGNDISPAREKSFSEIFEHENNRNCIHLSTFIDLINFFPSFLCTFDALSRSLSSSGSFGTVYTISQIVYNRIEFLDTPTRNPVNFSCVLVNIFVIYKSNIHFAFDFQTSWPDHKSMAFTFVFGWMAKSFFSNFLIWHRFASAPKWLFKSRHKVWTGTNTCTWCTGSERAKKRCEWQLNI